MKLKIKRKDCILKRLHSKLGEIVVWQVLTLDGASIGVVRQMNDNYMFTKVGWREFPTKYWLGSKYWKREHFVGRTRDSVIRQMLEI